MKIHFKGGCGLGSAHRTTTDVDAVDCALCLGTHHYKRAAEQARAEWAEQAQREAVALWRQAVATRETLLGFEQWNRERIDDLLDSLTLMSGDLLAAWA